ncbi:MAG: acylneuraminate cytidylyltransferase family protein [Defluviitaleaceae bacterium]|nr:acylneuraminate cytidylyltransferase family protein [Defluviitaleaceae bacterium]
MFIKALIAVRSGSLRLENKNLRPFAGSNLLQIKIEQLKRIKSLSGIIVNSNDDDMLNLAEKLGCEPVKREPYFASNTVSMSEVYEDMAKNFNSDYICYANVTNPLIKDITIENAIEEFKKNIDKYDSLNTAHLVKEFLFLDNKPINYELDKQPRSQDLPDISALNFAINILHRETMIKHKNVVSSKPQIYLIDDIEATDIDNPIDFSFSEFVYNINNKI